MRLERLVDRIEYCFKYGEDCLKPKAWEFVCDMKVKVDRLKDKITLTPKQHQFMGACFKLVMIAHPVENETTLDRMKRKLAELRARTKSCATAKRKRDLISSPAVDSISMGQFLNQFEETQVTAKSRPHGRRESVYKNRYDMRVAVKQSGRKSKET